MSSNLEKHVATVGVGLCLAGIAGGVSLLFELRESQATMTQKLETLERVMVEARLQGEKRIDDHEERIRAVEARVR